MFPGEEPEVSKPEYVVALRIVAEVEDIKKITDMINKNINDMITNKTDNLLFSSLFLIGLTLSINKSILLFCLPIYFLA